MSEHGCSDCKYVSCSGHLNPCFTCTNNSVSDKATDNWQSNDPFVGVTSSESTTKSADCGECQYGLTPRVVEPCKTCLEAAMEGRGQYTQFEQKTPADQNDFAQILLPIADLLQRKNSDYGSAYDELRDEYGEVAFLVRLSDKIGRLKSLHKREAQVKDESVDDTIRDIIGYCTLELRYREKKEGQNHEV